MYSSQVREFVDIISLGTDKMLNREHIHRHTRKHTLPNNKPLLNRQHYGTNVQFFPYLILSTFKWELLRNFCFNDVDDASTRFKYKRTRGLLRDLNDDSDNRIVQIICWASRRWTTKTHHTTRSHMRAQNLFALQMVDLVGWLAMRTSTTKFKYKKKLRIEEDEDEKKRANGKANPVELVSASYWMLEKPRANEWSYLNRFSIDAAPKIRAARKKEEKCT